MSSYVKESTLAKYINKQILSWEKSKSVEAKSEEAPRPFITVSREYGTNCAAICEVIAKRLNAYEKVEEWQSYDKELIDKIVEDGQVSEKLIETIDTKKREEISELVRSMVTDYPPQVVAYKKLVQTIRSLSECGRAIIVGRAGVVITRGLKFGTHIKFVAPFSYRVRKVMELNNIKDKAEAERIVETKDRERHAFLTQYIKFDAKDPVSYDVTINISRYTTEQVADIVIGILKAKGHIK